MGDFEYTAEQKTIIDTDVGDTMRVMAYAGTGKTTTLNAYTRERSDQGLKFIYLAFNKSVEREARKIFPEYVTVKTAHALAMKATEAWRYNDIYGSLYLKPIANILKQENYSTFRDYDKAGAVRHTLCDNYLHSCDHEIETHHVPDGIDDVQSVLDGAKLIWDKMKDDDDDDIPMIHDGYLKLFQQDQRKRPSLHNEFDVILFDEAQDADPPIFDIVKSQKVPKIFIGDPHQSIYAWRKAINAMQKIDVGSGDTYHLTKSFRFGENIANIATQLLDNWKLDGIAKPVRGMGTNDDKVYATEDVPRDRVDAVLHRTYAEAVNTAIQEAQQDHKISWVGGIRNYDLDSLLDLFWLCKNQEDRIKDYRFKKTYTSYDEYKKIADKADDKEMKRSINIVEKYDDLPDRIDEVRNQTVEDDNYADIIVSTAHRAKGCEWDSVALAEDFSDLYKTLDNKGKKHQSTIEFQEEVNLLYVSFTRARSELMIPEYIVRFAHDIGPIEEGESTDTIDDSDINGDLDADPGQNKKSDGDKTNSEDKNFEKSTPGKPQGKKSRENR